MPLQELPESVIKNLSSSSNSSLSSTSSDIILINANYVRNIRSDSESSVSNNDEVIEPNLLNANNYNQIHPSNEGEESGYQPIRLPKEPTLEELLRQVTGGGDITSIQQIKLRLISSAVSLHRLPYFMPLLRILNLEGSMLFSLRDLGCDLTNLTYLNISRCGLKSLDGSNSLPNLTEIIVDFNCIEDAGPCSNFSQIRKISLISNKIKDFQGITFLGLCSNLKVLDLTNNLITLKENYREKVQQNIPQLMILDKIHNFGELDEQAKIELLRSEYKPANNGVARNSINLDGIQPMPAIPFSTQISITRRLISSAGSKRYDVSVGEPVCGNIITKARKVRTLKTAWGESCSSSSLSSSDSSNLGTPVNKAKLSNENESSEEILESSKLWRERNKDSREKFNKL